MAQSGGPEKVGAVSFDVNANLAPAQKSLEDIKTEAGKKGEEAGKAFSEGVAKGAKAGAEATKFTGEGSDVFVGPARPTGKDEAARQWALTQEAAAGGGGGAGGAAEGAGAAAGVGGVVAGAAGAVAVAGLIIGAVKAFEAAALKMVQSNYELGKSLGDALFDTRKQMMELDQAFRLNAEALSDSQGTRASRFKEVTAGNPNISDAMEKRTKFLEDDRIALQKRLADLTKNPAQRLIEQSMKVGGFGMMIDDVGEAMALREQIAADTESLDGGGGTRMAVSGIARREKERGTFGGRLAAGGASDPNRPIGIGMALGSADAAAVDDWILNNREQAKAAAEWQQKSWMQRQDQITEMRRGNLNRKVDQ